MFIVGDYAQGIDYYKVISGGVAYLIDKRTALYEEYCADTETEMDDDFKESHFREGIFSIERGMMFFVSNV